jgi:hypothetical protein
VKQLAGKTTPTDSRSRRIRASRRSGHLLTRAQSPPNETSLPIHVCLKAPLSRNGRTVLTAPDAIGRRSGRWEPRQRPRRFIPDTNPLERFNREIGRRTDVVGIFPDQQAATKLIYLAIIKADAKWQRSRTWSAPRAALKIHFGDRYPG